MDGQYKNLSGSGKMAQWEKAPAAKPDDLSSKERTDSC